jgi:hypothetical protein
MLRPYYYPYGYYPHEPYAYYGPRCRTVWTVTTGYPLASTNWAVVVNPVPSPTVNRRNLEPNFFDSAARRLKSLLHGRFCLRMGVVAPVKGAWHRRVTTINAHLAALAAEP